MENNEEKKFTISYECKKLIIIALMTFLGAFLAFYVLMHQTIMHSFKRHPHSSFVNEKALKHYEKRMENDFEEIGKKEISKFKNKVSAVQTLKYDDAYVIVVNLKPFNNNENNIRFSLNGNVATVSGNVVTNKRNGETAYYITESFEIPEKIDINEIQKEKVDGKYIITLPIEN